MSDLPPDPPRLRAILAHLDRQIADTETITTYLRLQRQAVERALTAADRPQRATRPETPKQPPRRPPNAPTGTGNGYMLEMKRHPKDPRPAHLHVDDCTMADRATSPIAEEQFRVGLKDPEFMEPCEFCRPQDKLSDEPS